MLDNQFREFLEQAGKFTQNAINSRVAKANAAERILGCSLDSVAVSYTHLASDNRKCHRIPICFYAPTVHKAGKPILVSDLSDCKRKCFCGIQRGNTTR